MFIQNNLSYQIELTQWMKCNIFIIIIRRLISTIFSFEYLKMHCDKNFKLHAFDRFVLGKMLIWNKKKKQYISLSIIELSLDLERCQEFTQIFLSYCSVIDLSVYAVFCFRETNNLIVWYSMWNRIQWSTIYRFLLIKKMLVA